VESPPHLSLTPARMAAARRHRATRVFGRPRGRPPRAQAPATRVPRGPDRRERVRVYADAYSCRLRGLRRPRAPAAQEVTALPDAGWRTGSRGSR